jgi:hypothetical protein
MAARRAIKPTAGARLIAELAKDDDPFSVTLLIEDAAQTADFLERLRPVLNGDRRGWLELKLGAKTVEVVVTNPLVQYRQLSEHLRRLLVTIHGQRASIPGVDDDGDDPTAV